MLVKQWCCRLWCLLVDTAVSDFGQLVGVVPSRAIRCRRKGRLLKEVRLGRVLSNRLSRAALECGKLIMNSGLWWLLLMLLCIWVVNVGTG